jgi:hypothetical protein
MTDLMGRVNTGIGSSRRLNAGALAAKGEDGIFEHFLHRKSVFLVLPANEFCAVIFDDQFEPCHQPIR